MCHSKNFLEEKNISNANNIMTYLILSPLYPLKGRIAANLSNNMLTTISPLRGQGVSKYDNIFLPQLECTNAQQSAYFSCADFRCAPIQSGIG